MTDNNKICNQGWRQFYCESCDYIWKQQTRDYKSLSTECCPECNEEAEIMMAWPDPSVKVDKYYNLVDLPEIVEIPKHIPQKMDAKTIKRFRKIGVLPPDNRESYESEELYKIVKKLNEEASIMDEADKELDKLINQQNNNEN